MVVSGCFSIQQKHLRSTDAIKYFKYFPLKFGENSWGYIDIYLHVIVKKTTKLKYKRVHNHIIFFIIRYTNLSQNPHITPNV